MPRAVKATGNARRHMTYADFGVLAKKRPEKSLTVSLKKHAGRDKRGHISIRHRGGGAKRLYRMVDFKFLPFEGKATVVALEYDPNRSAFLALLEMPDKSKKYILAPEGLKAGAAISSGSKANTTGSRVKLSEAAIGAEVHNVEIQPGRGGQIVRSAGSAAIVTAKEGKYAYLRMPSSEVRKVLLECMASIGRVSNATHNLVRTAKAGRVRLRGRRPTVRGKAMNPNSHPHGGGEAVNPIGLKYPKTPWGKHALGVKTRRNKRTDKFIVSRRKMKK
jgi:large subunit ribosomal protein L2